MDELDIFNEFLKTGVDPIPSISKIKLNRDFGNILVSDSEISELKRQFYALHNIKPVAKCLAPVQPRCSARPIRSHSIQRNGPLRMLAEDNHVMMFSSDVSNFDEGPSVEAKLVGVKKATTFPGLCEHHDNEIFCDIESGEIDTLTSRQELLFAYRALLREVYAKECHYLMVREMVRNVTQKQDGRFMQKAIIGYAYQVYQGLCDISRILRKFESCYKDGSDSSWLNTRSLIIDWQLPFSCSGHFTPKYSLSGRRIPFGNLKKNGLPWMSMSVLPQQSSTVISIAWDNVHRRQLKHLVRDIQRSDTDSISHLAWQLALRESENLVVSPVAWNKLSETEKTTTVNFFQATIFERWVPWIDVYLNDPFRDGQEYAGQA